MPFQFRKEAIEEDLNSNFPSQGQGNPPLYYSLSEVVVPTYSINNVAEGTSLPESLQQAWDFSTSAAQINNTTTNLITTTGFWKVDLTYTGDIDAAAATNNARIEIFDGITAKQVWAVSNFAVTGVNSFALAESSSFVVFLRSGDTLRGISTQTAATLDVWYRQIADVNGNLVNPLGFSFA